LTKLLAVVSIQPTRATVHQ